MSSGALAHKRPGCRFEASSVIFTHPGNGQVSPYQSPEEFARGPSRPGIFPYPRSVGDFGTPLVEPAPEIRDDSLRVALTINFAEFLLTN